MSILYGIAIAVFWFSLGATTLAGVQDSVLWRPFAVALVLSGAFAFACMVNGVRNPWRLDR